MRMHPASTVVTRLELFFHDLELPHATGFIYGFGQDMALVSNWHVFSGRHPVTNIPFNRDGIVPKRVKFHATNTTLIDGGANIHFIGMDLPLEVDGEAVWWQHPGYKDEHGGIHQVDVGVLPLMNVFDDFDTKRKTISSFESQVIISVDPETKEQTYQQGTARIGSEIFILGFPKGLATQGIFPIWKRGSIASEPLYNLQGNVPVFLTDALTRDGMSGSPVIYFGPEIVGEDGYPTGVDRKPTDEPWLLGVYAGRKGSTQDELEMAVGRVWKKSLLDFIFFNKIPGGTPPQMLVNERPASAS